MIRSVGCDFVRKCTVFHALHIIPLNQFCEKYIFHRYTLELVWNSCFRSKLASFKRIWSTMAITWTGARWNVLMDHHHLEVLSVAMYIFCRSLLGVVSAVILLYSLVCNVVRLNNFSNSKNIIQSMISTSSMYFSLKLIQFCGSIYLKLMAGSYLMFIWYDRHSGDRGGRGVG